MRAIIVSSLRWHFRPFVAAQIFCVLLLGTDVGLALTVRIGDWNVANLPNTNKETNRLKTVLNYIGTFAPAGSAQALDILALQETDTTSIATTATAANSVYGVSSYTYAASSPDGAGDRTGFVYNSATVSLTSSVELSDGLTHNILRGRFRPVGTSGSYDFDLYSVHLKSGDTTADEQTRVSEAQQLRADADALGSANVIFSGDFNWNSADELGPDPTVSAWDVFAAAGNGQVADPVNAVGNWRDNAAFKLWHTQDPKSAMDDRFDMQLISGELQDGSGLEYVAGSYSVIANNGTHTLNGKITTGSGATSAVRSALAAFSDHLPVIADYFYPSGQLVAAIPEPNSMMLAIAALVGALSSRRRDGRMYQA